MTDVEKVLDGMRKIYVQNQQILTRIEAIEKSVGTVEATNGNQQRTSKRPWENGWSKDKDGTQKHADQEVESIDKIRETFKI